MLVFCGFFFLQSLIILFGTDTNILLFKPFYLTLSDFVWLSRQYSNLLKHEGTLFDKTVPTQSRLMYFSGLFNHIPQPVFIHFKHF